MKSADDDKAAPGHARQQQDQAQDPSTSKIVADERKGRGGRGGGQLGREPVYSLPATKLKLFQLDWRSVRGLQ